MHHRNVGFRLHRRISRSNRNESRACRLAKIPNGFFHKPLKSRFKVTAVLRGIDEGDSRELGRQIAMLGRVMLLELLQLRE